MPLPRRGTGALPRSRFEPEPEQNPDGIHLADHPAVQHSVYLVAFWPQKGQSAIEMVGGELPGWVAARDDGTVVVSSDLVVVWQTLCADIDAERFAKEVYPRYVAASCRVRPLPVPPRCPAPHDLHHLRAGPGQPAASPGSNVFRRRPRHRLPSSHSSFLSMPKHLARTLGGAISSA
jgi:hypothetical protein